MADPITLRPGRTEVEALTAAGVRVMLGGREFTLRPLTMAENRLWVGIYVDSLRKYAATSNEIDGLADAYGFLGNADPALDILTAYDVDHVLDREWIDRNATPHQVLAAADVIVRYAVPQLSGPTALLPETIRRLVVGLIQGPSPEPTSSPSTSGTTAPRKNSRRR